MFSVTLFIWRSVCDSYSASFIDSCRYLEDIFKVQNKHADSFMKCCIRHKYVPKQYTNVLCYAPQQYWNDFVIRCQPDESFVKTYIVPRATGETWATLSGKDKLYKVRLSDSFIKEFSSNLHWDYLMKTYEFDVDTILPHLDEGGLETISKHQKLTPDFIDEHADGLDWYYLCEHQQLPEWLMEKHNAKLNWGQVSSYQDLSKDFVMKYKDKLNENKLLMNHKIAHIFYKPY
jgi:hypothetical protein